MLYENWQRANGRPTMFGPQAASQQSGPPTAVGSAPHGASDDVPVAGTAPAAVPASGAAAPTTNNAGPTASAGATAPAKGERIAVTTDLFAIDLNTLGATIDRVELLRYRDADDAKRDFVLLDDTPGYYYVAQSGLVGRRPAARRCRTTASRSVRCPGRARSVDGQDTLDVAFEAEAGGVTPDEDLHVPSRQLRDRRAPCGHERRRRRPSRRSSTCSSCATTRRRPARRASTARTSAPRSTATPNASRRSASRTSRRARVRTSMSRAPTTAGSRCCSTTSSTAWIPPTGDTRLLHRPARREPVPRRPARAARHDRGRRDEDERRAALHRPDRGAHAREGRARHGPRARLRLDDDPREADVLGAREDPLGTSATGAGRSSC